MINKRANSRKDFRVGATNTTPTHTSHFLDIKMQKFSTADDYDTLGHVLTVYIIYCKGSKRKPRDRRTFYPRYRSRPMVPNNYRTSRQASFPRALAQPSPIQTRLRPDPPRLPSWENNPPFSQRCEPRGARLVSPDHRTKNMVERCSSIKV